MSNCRVCKVFLLVGRNCREGSSTCRPCLAKAQRAWVDKNRAQVRKTNRQSCLRHREKRNEEQRLRARTVYGRHLRLRHILRQDGVHEDKLWSLGFYSALVADCVCHYCGGSLSETGHGLDRVDNSKSHVCYNVVPCCAFCNEVKGCVFSYEEMMLLAPTLREIRRRRNDVGTPMSQVRKRFK